MLLMRIVLALSAASLPAADALVAMTDLPAILAAREPYPQITPAPVVIRDLVVRQTASYSGTLTEVVGPDNTCGYLLANKSKPALSYRSVLPTRLTDQERQPTHGHA